MRESNASLTKGYDFLSHLNSRVLNRIFLLNFEKFSFAYFLSIEIQLIAASLIQMLYFAVGSIHYHVEMVLRRFSQGLRQTLFRHLNTFIPTDFKYLPQLFERSNSIIVFGCKIVIESYKVQLV